MHFLRLYVAISLLTSFILIPFSSSVDAFAPVVASEKKPEKAAASSIFQQRMELFQQMESLYGIPWWYLAAIDQYERTMKKRKQKEEPTSRITAVTFPATLWSGLENPAADDTSVSSIAFFGGIGQDGDGDGQASQDSDADVLTTMIRFLGSYGFTREDFRIGLWMYYQRDQAVRVIDQFAAVYEKYQTLELDKHAFPIPRRYNYSYNNTWGDARGWGGRRIHEGTDIFASHGTPVLSTGYGVVEVVGWNRYGGWRIGMRDMDNVYHYFAHLSAFKKGLKVGDIVEPGQVIGYVGSSGYGRPGTSGKFPPHLHYGMYRDMGSDEWAFDPYPYLKRWERQMRSKRK